MMKGKQLRKKVLGMQKQMGGVGKAIMAGAAGAALLVGNIGKIFRDKAAGISDYAQGFKQRNSREGIVVRKSTLVAIIVALAAIAGVLGALYVYVLRRERELDEYEQLLFSEDFDDDYSDDEGALPEEVAPAQEPEKA